MLELFEKIGEHFGNMKWDTWTILGFVGTACYFSRIVWQWVLSEKAKKPVIPASYWIMSLGGAFLLTIYSIARNDPIYLLNYIVPLAIYARQLVLHYRSESADSQPGDLQGD